MDEEAGLRLEAQPVTFRQMRFTPGRVEVELSSPSPRRAPYPENMTAFAYAFLPLRARRIARLFLSTLSVTG